MALLSGAGIVPLHTHDPSRAYPWENSLYALFLFFSYTYRAYYRKYCVCMYTIPGADKSDGQWRVM
jgi:hypothetical protein